MVSLPVNISEIINATTNITDTGIGVVSGVAHSITGYIPMGFTFGLEHIIELLMIHTILLFVFHRVIGLFKSVIVAGIASVALPFVLSRFFGFAIPLTAETFVTFALFGVGIYVVLAIFWKLAFRARIRA